MAPQSVVYVSKTQHYLKVKKPLLERQRRARINKCLDTLKTLVADFQADDAILRMDKAEMLEAALAFMRKQLTKQTIKTTLPAALPMDSFKNGYMNAVNEVSRVMAGTPAMSVDVGKAVMTQLGFEFQRLIRYDNATQQQQQQAAAEFMPHNNKRPISPASSGYYSDEFDETELPTMASEQQQQAAKQTQIVWRPW